MEGMRRPAPAPPDALGTRDGLAFAAFLPDQEPLGRLVILHGAGSCKENHFDFARAARAAGIAAVAFDQRGHGDSSGALDGRAIADVATMAAVLPGGGPLALRGSSMGGYLALVAAAQLDAAAVVAICPAAADHLARGLREGRFAFRADVPALDAFLVEHPLDAVVSDLRAQVLLLHAEGDEQVPIAHSRALAADADPERWRFVAIPGGDHRSIQHDPDLQALALRFLGGVLVGA
jgi:alpha-beta hydrolase superfamily lysophospholipase